MYICAGVTSVTESPLRLSSTHLTILKPEEIDHVERAAVRGGGVAGVGPAPLRLLRGSTEQGVDPPHDGHYSADVQSLRESISRSV